MYETGTASGVVDLITKLEAFMSANSWTTDSFATEGAGKRYHAHNGSVFLNARAYNVETPSASILQGGTANSSGLAMNISTAGTGGSSAWFDKTGGPVGSGGEFVTAGINGLTGAIASYHFFAQNSGTAITVVVEYVSGYYQFICFGTLAKYGTYTGGQYMSASHSGVSSTIQISNGVIPGVGFFSKSANSASPGLISVSVDSETGWHWSDGFQSARDATRRYVRCNEARYVNSLPLQPNSLNSLAVLSPVVCSVDRGVLHGGSDRVSPIGELPGTFLLRISQLTPAQQITLGSTDYRVFPFWHKNAAADIPDLVAFHSSYYGFAVAE